MSRPMEEYLELERAMSAADDAGNEVLADALRERLDTIWLSLTDAEHETLDARGEIAISSEAERPSAAGQNRNDSPV